VCEYQCCLCFYEHILELFLHCGMLLFYEENIIMGSTIRYITQSEQFVEKKINGSSTGNGDLKYIYIIIHK